MFHAVACFCVKKNRVVPCPSYDSVQIRRRGAAGVLAHGGDQLQTDLAGGEYRGLDGGGVAAEGDDDLVGVAGALVGSHVLDERDACRLQGLGAPKLP